MRSQPNYTGAAFPLKALVSLTRGHWWLSLLLWVFLISPTWATQLRVAIKKNISQIKIGSSTPALIKDGAGRVLGEMGEMNALTAQVNGRGVSINQFSSANLVVEPSNDGYIWIGDRWYRGRVRLMRQGQRLIAVNQLNIEEYLYSVVGAEAVPNWPLDALKAQAVAARTYAIYKSTTSGNRFYDLDTTTKTQVYKGLESEYVSTHDAVDQTRGQVMTYNSKVILAVFHSSSGGHTENVEDVWNSPLPYLRGVVDYDQLSPVFQWNKTFTTTQMSRLIGGIGTIRAMVPERTTPNGRIVTMKVVGTGGTKRVNGIKLREVLGLRSTLFTVSENNGTFEVLGRGYGHGLGLSQWGSEYLATQGVSYDQILTHYYQNAQLTAMEK